MIPNQSHSLFRTACAVAVLLVAGCSSTVSGTARDSKHPEITFDPCLDIPDAVITQTKHDPTTEYREDLKGESFYWLGCGYVGRRDLFGVNSGISTIAKAKNDHAQFGIPTTINDRESIITNDPTQWDACAIFMATSYGSIMIDKTLTSEGRDRPPCDGIEDLARIIEPTIIDTYKK